MKNKVVRELMVPLSEYATVSQDAILYDAVMALEKAQKEYSERLYKHRAVLVLDNRGHVVGKVSQHDVLRALEPRYKEMGDMSKIHWGLSKAFVDSMMKQFELFETPLENVCHLAGKTLVKDVMYSIGEGEYVKVESTLDNALHQFVIGHHQSLLVTEKGRVVGILRLTDVFQEVVEIIKTCGI